MHMCVPPKISPNLFFHEEILFYKIFTWTKHNLHKTSATLVKHLFLKKNQLKSLSTLLSDQKRRLEIGVAFVDQTIKDNIKVYIYIHTHTQHDYNQITQIYVKGNYKKICLTKLLN